MLRRLRFPLVLLFVLSLAAAVPHTPLAPRTARAAPVTFSSVNAVGVSTGSAAPYPSTLAVSGLTGTVLHLSVTLTGLTYRSILNPAGCNWSALDILLVGPGGQASIVMSDVNRDG